MEDVLIKYINNKYCYLIHYKIIAFVCDLKYGLGENKFNYNLSDYLIGKILQVKDVVGDVRVNYQLMWYLKQEIKQNCVSKVENNIDHLLLAAV